MVGREVRVKGVGQDSVAGVGDVNEDEDERGEGAELRDCASLITR